MTEIEKGFAIGFILVLCFWAFVWMLDDWRNDGEDKDK